MADCQLVLRYFALKHDGNIRGSMRSMLDRAMEERTKISEADAHALEEEFKGRFTFLYSLFDGKPFRLPPDDRGRSRVSAALYDASMVAADKLWSQKDKLERDKQGVLARMEAVLHNHDQLTILTGQRNTAEAVRSRITLMKEILEPSV
jgi:hypothetical protein